MMWLRSSFDSSGLVPKRPTGNPHGVGIPASGPFSFNSRAGLGISASSTIGCSGQFAVRGQFVLAVSKSGDD
jgi:hypothetical protein